jgi:cytochrome c551/c552
MSQNPNKLCFVCHANDRSVKGLVFTDMQSEFVGQKTCVECHMGKKRRDVAATYKFNGKAKMRMVRNHGFKGGHISSMWKNALNLKLQKRRNKLYIIIKNPQPHNIPSGFGSRELVLDIVYKKDDTILKKSEISLTRHYKRKRNKVTIAHLAIAQSKDMSVKAHGKKVLKIDLLQDADRVEVRLYYRLVNDEVRTLLDLKDPLWSQRSFITSAALELQ